MHKYWVFATLITTSLGLWTIFSIVSFLQWEKTNVQLHLGFSTQNLTKEPCSQADLLSWDGCVSNVISLTLQRTPNFWEVPIFHCQGWSCAWLAPSPLWLMDSSHCTGTLNEVSCSPRLIAEWKILKLYYSYNSFEGIIPGKCSMCLKLIIWQ